MQIEDSLEKYFEIFNNLSAEYEINLRIIEQNSKFKNEAEKLKKDVLELKKNTKEDNDRWLKEKLELTKKYEKEKFEDVMNIENNLKQNHDKIKQKLYERDELVGQLQEENNIIRNQLDLLDKNLSNYKNSRSNIE